MLNMIGGSDGYLTRMVIFDGEPQQGISVNIGGGPQGRSSVTTSGVARSREPQWWTPSLLNIGGGLRW